MCATKEKTVDLSLLDEVMSEYASEEDRLITILQKAQDIYGYLPEDVIYHVAERTGHSPAKVMGVATFYSQFSLNPKGKYRISVCLGTACYVKGASLILDKIKDTLKIDNGECTDDGKFSIDACRCVGACGLAPVMLVNDDVYGRLTPDQVPDILAKYE